MNKRSFLFIFAITMSVMFIHQTFSNKKAAQKAPAQEEVVRERETKVLPGDYYVLENDYQQVVFTTAGGAIAEINLPFKSKENSASIVRSIGVDKTLKERYEAEATFPLKEATYVVDGKREQKAPVVGGYTPLLRRHGGHYAMGVVDDEGKAMRYTVREMTADRIVMEGSDSGRRVVKTFTLASDAPYMIDCDVQVSGDTRGLFLTSGVPEVELVSGAYSPSVRYSVSQGKKSSVDKIKLPKNASTVTSVDPKWVSNSNGFFGVIMNPLGESHGFEVNYIKGSEDPTRLSVIDPQYKLYPADKYPGYEVLMPLKKSSNYRFFAGPYETGLLKSIDAKYQTNFVEAKSITGWYSFIGEPFAKFLYLIIDLFHSATGSWGFSIILLTIVLRIMMFPLNNWSIKSSERMKRVTPLLKKLQEKYKNDPKRLQMEQLQLYREHKANPFMGCLPMIIQLPFLMGMFELLKTTFQLRGAPFIPGWINNLAAPDVLFSWNYPVIFFGTQFHLLPFLLGGIMIIQSKLMGPSMGASKEQEQQGKMMQYMMPVVMTFIFYKFPAGLNIYWISSSALDLLQRWATQRKLNAKPYEVAKKVK